MAKPKAWDGKLYVVICPIKGGGWYPMASFTDPRAAAMACVVSGERVLCLTGKLPASPPGPCVEAGPCGEAVCVMKPRAKKAAK